MHKRLEEKPAIGAYHVDARSMLRRLRAVTTLCKPSDRVLFVGDDDLASLALHHIGFANLTVIDIDRDLLGVLARETRDRVHTMPYDLRSVYDGKWPKISGGFSLFVTDPPYGADGLRVFSAVGLRSLAVGGHGLIATPERRAAVTRVGDPEQLTHSLQSFLLQSGAVIQRVESGAARSYHGTVASVLWVKKIKRCAPDLAALTGPRAFY